MYVLAFCVYLHLSTSKSLQNKPSDWSAHLSVTKTSTSALNFAQVHSQIDRRAFSHSKEIRSALLWLLLGAQTMECFRAGAQSIAGKLFKAHELNIPSARRLTASRTIKVVGGSFCLGLDG